MCSRRIPKGYQSGSPQSEGRTTLGIALALAVALLLALPATVVPGVPAWAQTSDGPIAFPFPSNNGEGDYGSGSDHGDESPDRSRDDRSDDGDDDAKTEVIKGIFQILPLLIEHAASAPTLELDRTEIESDQEQEIISGQAQGNDIVVTVEDIVVALSGEGRFEMPWPMPAPGSAESVAVVVRDGKGRSVEGTAVLTRSPVVVVTPPERVEPPPPEMATDPEPKPVPEEPAAEDPVERSLPPVFVPACGPVIDSPSTLVREVQVQLNALGYNAGSADGIAGRNTCKAIDDALEDRGVSAAWTWEALSDILGEVVTPAAPPPAPPVDVVANPEPAQEETPPEEATRPELTPAMPVVVAPDRTWLWALFAGVALGMLLLIAARKVASRSKRTAASTVAVHGDAGQAAAPSVITSGELTIALRVDARAVAEPRIQEHRRAA
jgi:peptidoglycan hydrolase-like protein with peptidoglycan-binding domain